MVSFRIGPVAAVAASLMGQSAWAARGLTITGPTSSVGDGETVVILTARDEGAQPGELELEVEVDAGNVLAVMPSGSGEYQINLVPPRVAMPRQVNVEARLKGEKDKEAKFFYTAQPLPATLGVSRSQGPLDIRGPRTLVLARTPAIEMSVGRPANGAPGIYASVGTVTTPERRNEDGRLYFKYIPPVQRFPQYAILAGMTPDGWTFDWITIELHGMARVSTRAKPYSLVVNRVAGVEYGPARAGVDRHVEMVVQTPPGVAHGMTVATDLSGKTTEKQLDFATPPWNRLLALCPRKGDSVVALVVDVDGRPKEGEALAVHATSGTVGAFQELAAGVYEASYSSGPASRAAADAGAVSSDVKITIKIPGDPASSSSCTISPAAMPQTADPAAPRGSSYGE